MVNRLSAKYQKEIALGMLCLFFISGLGSLKASTMLPGRYNFPSRVYSGYTGSKRIAPANEPAVKQGSEDKITAVNRKMLLPGVKSAALLSPASPFIGGPGQPEMSSFKSVGADNMVSPFTGDFSYNIPLLDVGGYPVNMFYNSGITMDQEASWVGLGWNINPGTVSRNMRGIPDDFDGTDEITKTQSIKPDKTWGVTGGADIKYAGFPYVGFGINAGVSYNNRLGVATEAGINITLNSGKAGDNMTGSLSLGLNGSARNGASVTPSINIGLQQKNGQDGNLSGSLGLSYTYSSRMGLTAMHLNAGVSKSRDEIMEHYNDETNKTEKIGDLSGSQNMGTFSSSISFAYPTVVPSSRSILTRKNFNLSFSMGGEIYSINIHGRLGGFYSETKIADADKVVRYPAYGMLHYQDAANNPNGMLDFNRANDGVYTPNSPAVGMPVYTYDVFSVNGEGVGGSFRATRSDIGYMRDPRMKTREDAASVGVDLGFGNIVHAGAEISYVYTPSEIGAWEVNNTAKDVFAFKENKGDYQAVYFRNPGEKTIPDAAYQAGIGGEDLVRLKMSNIASGTPLLLPRLIRYDATKNKLGETGLTSSSVIRQNRDKRTQVISFMTAEESERMGFDRYIYSYKSTGADSNKVIISSGCNTAGVDTFYRHSQGIHPEPLLHQGEGDDFRKGRHISEFNVLGTDGRKYVYGLPVYNTKQVDVSFSIDKSQANTSTSKVVYDADDDTKSNKKGRDWFLEMQETPAYTHSYLLTALLSPNYVDVTGNGISDDDMGDAIKFNYSKFQNYKWRTPVGNMSATYSEGLKTDAKDDKAHYVYGEREMWLLYSIESKNMVARFFVKNDRQDCREVVGQTGALNSAWGMQRLDKICLYSKGDLRRYGTNAKPIKTIRFFQSYKLCKNTASGSELGSTSNANQGKLTLDSIWVSYNTKQNKPKSRYVFSYPSGNNPDYSFNANDRWGNYKPETDGGANNIGSLPNSDFPYSVQDKTKADKYAAAWTMNRILLPSGAEITVDYESDSYAYVQNKRSASMYEISGFGNTDAPDATQRVSPYLYNGSVDCDRVYIKLPYAITSSNPAEAQRELGERYFDKLKQLYMKIWVTMPDKAGIPGSESIPVYADIERYGIVPGTSGTIAYVKVLPVVGSTSPMVQQALQFLKQQLPGKAYKGYDVSEEGGAQAIVTSLAGMIASIGALFRGDDETLKKNLKCRVVTNSKSFARLDNPYYDKYGGGLRVKKVTIKDNWNKMTGQYASSYGQEYRYTTRELVNGKMTNISSGVAAWEPSIGADENPFKEIMRYMDHNKGGPYDFGAIEMPFGEMFYPSPMVGYSRVEVLSVHRDTVKNLPTRQVSEFFTTRDFPFSSSATQLNDPEASVKYEPKKIMQLLKLDNKKAITLSQGFLVNINDMNGREKSQATYSALDSINPVSYTQNFYNTKQATDKTYTFNHTVPTINSPNGVVQSSVVGRDIELMADFRQHKTETITTNLNINLDLFLIGWFPIPLFNPLQPVVRESMVYRSASVLKVVNHYGMLDSVVVIDKGSMVSTKNMVYDAETGNVLLTRTQNEHNKPVYNFTYPAHWAYSGMGPAYKNIDAVYSGLTFRHGKLVSYPDGLAGILESGDELYVLSMKDNGPSGVSPCDDTPGTDPWTTLAKNPAKKIWAVYTGKAGSSTPQFVFMDAEGNPYNAVDVSIKIMRSGHRNLLDQSVASITSLANPINGSNQLVFNDNTNIIQTGAATFKDHWRVDNVLYKKDSVVDFSTYARVKKANIPLSDYMNGGNHQYQGSSPGYNTSKDPYALSYKWGNRHGGGGGTPPEISYSRSFLLFNYSGVMPSNAKIYSAYLSLYSHTIANRGMGSSATAIHSNFPKLHSNSTSHTANLPGVIQAMKGNWYPLANVSDWGNNYMSVYSDPMVTASSSVIPGTVTGNDDYILRANSNGTYTDDRIPVLNLVNAATGTPLAAAGKLGLRLRLDRDAEFLGSPDILRCFWSNAPCGSSSFGGGDSSSVSCSSFNPRLTFYYYQCGDSSPVYNPDNDPYVNKLIKCDSTSIEQTFCLSRFSRKAINPYTEGIWGNWRVDSTYAYYGSRKETSPSSPVDTRTGGTIYNFKTFWNFNGSGYLTRNTSASDVWVWNSVITQYNRKGYEIENKDPLGRFNSGLYGYNQQLPVAVANNSRVREVMFDGYEDYDYQTAPDCITCKTGRHFNYDSSIVAKLDSTQRHTGRYSLKVNTSSYVKFKAPVVSVTDADKDYSMRVKIDSTAISSATSVGNTNNGTGLQAKYYNHTGTTYPLDPGGSGSTLILTRTEAPALPWSNSTSAPGVNGDYFSVKWEGKIQAPATGTYQFYGYADNAFRIKINGTQVSDNSFWTNGTVINSGYSSNVSMTMGQVYTIEVCFYETWGAQQFDLKWRINNGPLTNIPTAALYLPSATTYNPVTTVTTGWCTRLDSSNVRGNALTDTMSLIQGRKMVLSAWVKENSTDCKCSTYVNNTITLSYTGSATTETFHPAGSIIEGWQRYEAVFTIPATATAISVSLNNSSGTIPAYFDDVRIHPFNANMKSFVYHSSNLRLMSELDENNYASFYEYDDDGTLTRVKKETQRGVKTITETRSAIQKKITD